MFSSRVPSALGPNRIAAAVSALRAAGAPIIDLTASNPTTSGIGYPADLLTALSCPDALVYAPDPHGLPTARDAIAADYARRGDAVDPSRIVLTASTSEAYSALFKILCDPGDEVLVPCPSYPLFEHLLGLDAVKGGPYALDGHGDWAIDIDSVERALHASDEGDPLGQSEQPDRLLRHARRARAAPRVRSRQEPRHPC